MTNFFLLSSCAEDDTGTDDKSEIHDPAQRDRSEYFSRSAGSDSALGSDSGGISGQEKHTEHRFLEKAVSDMMFDAGTFELDDPDDGWYRGISTLYQLNSVTTGDGWYDVRDYFSPGYPDLYNTYDIHVSGSAYIADTD